MAKFQYIVTVGWRVDARNSDEAYDKFQEMRLKDAFWDNSSDGVELISGEEEWPDEV
jgi:hypothetical protein